MELSTYLRLTREFEELIQKEPMHLRLGKTLEFVRDNFQASDIFRYADQCAELPRSKSSLAQRVARAEAEIDAWPEWKKKAVQLQGSKS